MSVKKPLVLAIANPDENWYKLCADYSDKFDIEQARWNEIDVTSYPDTAACIKLFASHHPCDDRQTRTRIVKPDLIIIRMFSKYIGRLGESPDYKNIIYGLMHAGIPMINSFDAAITEVERPVMMGRLKNIQRRIGKDEFPLIPQTYYSESYEMIITPPTPFVLKVSFPHAGYGKLKITDKEQLEDIVSLLHLHHDYVCAEPFIESEYEVRIVFIAPDYYRAHKRTSFDWKVNYGNPNEREDLDMTPKYKMWIDEIRKEIPGMDTFCIDTIVDKNGKEYILEVNGSSHGLAPEHRQEELIKMRELVMMKLNLLEEPQKEEKPVLDSDKDLNILNLQNQVKFLETTLERRNKNQPKPEPVNVNTSKDQSRNTILYLIAFSALILNMLFWIIKK